MVSPRLRGSSDRMSIPLELISSVQNGRGLFLNLPGMPTARKAR